MEKYYVFYGINKNFNIKQHIRTGYFYPVRIEFFISLRCFQRFPLYFLRFPDFLLHYGCF